MNSRCRVLPAFILFVVGSLQSFCQDTSRVRETINILSSKKMAGRGYLENGHRKAAIWISDFFQKSGLKTLNGSYFQPFRLDQNLFAGKTSLTLDGRALKPGIHFLPKPDCPSISKQLVIRRLDSLQMNQIGLGNQTNFPNEAWLIARGAHPEKWFTSLYKPGCWIRQNPKLTHSLSQTQGLIPEMIIPDSVSLPDKATISLDINARLKKGIHSQNVVAIVAGMEKPDSFLVVTAHYDHLGKLGKETWFPGANDNASGTAMMLELAHFYAKNPSRLSMVFIAFSGEEAGLLGSFHFVENSMIPINKIKFLLNLDLLGYGDQGATIVNATLHPVQFERMKTINLEKGYLPEIKSRGKAANSDHYPFSEKGVPAFFMYTLGGPGHYHDVHDKPETINLSHFKASFGLIRDFLDGF